MFDAPISPDTEDVVLFKEHTAAITSVAVAVSGGRHILASGSVDTTIIVRDLDTGQILYILEEHNSPITALAISKDGKHLASGSDDGIVILWNLDTGKCQQTLPKKSEEIRNLACIAIHSDLANKIIACGYICDWVVFIKTGCITLWDFENKRYLEETESPVAYPNDIRAIIISPDGKRMVSGSTDRTINVWDLEHKQSVASFKLLSPSGRVQSLAISSNGEFAAVSTSESIHIWNLKTKENVSLRVPRTITSKVQSLAMNADGSMLVSGNTDNTIGLWFRGNNDNTISLWDRTTGTGGRTFGKSITAKPLLHSTGHFKGRRGILCVAFSPDSQMVVAGREDATIDLWKLTEDVKNSFEHDGPKVATSRYNISKRSRKTNGQRDYSAITSILQRKREVGEFDVFLCYNNQDKSRVIKIAERLKKQGILPWLDEWELRPGLLWQDLLEQQIGQIKTAAVFVGKDGIGPWQQMEIQALLREFVNRRCPVIPVLLLEALSEPELPIFLKGMTWVDFHKRDPDPLERLIWGITGKHRNIV